MPRLLGSASLTLLLVAAACSGGSAPAGDLDANARDASPSRVDATAEDTASSPDSSPVPGDVGSDVESDTRPANAPTYFHDVKPIVDARCVKCHTDGGIAPFPLTNYQEVKSLKGAVKNAVTEEIMPPYLAGDGCTSYKHDTSLSDQQITTIEKWVETGAYRGSPENEGDPLPEVKSGLSRVDQTLRIPKAYKPRRSPDDYRCFPIEVTNDETKFATGFGVNPDKSQIVHHVIAYLASPSLSDEIKKKNAAEEGPGYTCFGGPGVGNAGSATGSVGWLAAWAPGGPGMDFPDGTGIEIEPNSTIVLQVHYNTLTADPTPDQTEIALKLSDSVDKQARFVPFTNPTWVNQEGAMNIPAGADGVTHSFSYDIASIAGSAVTVHDVFFHMHQLGDSGRLWIDRSDETTDCLLDIPRGDSNWQRGYRLTSPKTLRKGDELGIECVWDNTRSNQPVINGQRQSPTDVDWGEGTTDEMCLGVLYTTMAN